jgi:hypothetical protein
VRSERLSRTTVGFALIALLASGCDGGEPGASASEPTTSGVATPTVAVPPRPREVGIDGVDPCKLLTGEQLRELKVARQPRPTTAENQAPELIGPECVFSVTDAGKFYDYSVQVLNTEGIEAWLTGKRLVNAELVSVGGFPAVDFYHRGNNPINFSCYTSVGVADGQQLLITMQPTSQGFGQEQMCAMSERAAGLALQTLQTMK